MSKTPNLANFRRIIRRGRTPFSGAVAFLATALLAAISFASEPLPTEPKVVDVEASKSQEEYKQKVLEAEEKIKFEEPVFVSKNAKLKLDALNKKANELLRQYELTKLGAARYAAVMKAEEGFYAELYQTLQVRLGLESDPELARKIVDFLVQLPNKRPGAEEFAKNAYDYLLNADPQWTAEPIMFSSSAESPNQGRQEDPNRYYGIVPWTSGRLISENRSQWEQAVWNVCQRVASEPSESRALENEYRRFETAKDPDDAYNAFIRDLAVVLTYRDPKNELARQALTLVAASLVYYAENDRTWPTAIEDLKTSGILDPMPECFAQPGAAPLFALDRKNERFIQNSPDFLEPALDLEPYCDFNGTQIAIDYNQRVQEGGRVNFSRFNGVKTYFSKSRVRKIAYVRSDGSQGEAVVYPLYREDGTPMWATGLLSPGHPNCRLYGSESEQLNQPTREGRKEQEDEFHEQRLRGMLASFVGQLRTAQRFKQDVRVFILVDEPCEEEPSFLQNADPNEVDEFIETLKANTSVTRVRAVQVLGEGAGESWLLPDVWHKKQNSVATNEQPNKKTAPLDEYVGPDGHDIVAKFKEQKFPHRRSVTLDSQSEGADEGYCLNCSAWNDTEKANPVEKFELFAFTPNVEHKVRVLSRNTGALLAIDRDFSYLGRVVDGVAHCCATKPFVGLSARPETLHGYWTSEDRAAILIPTLTSQDRRQDAR